MIGVHPRALLEFDKQSPELKDTIGKQIAGYDGPVNFYVDKLSEASRKSRPRSRLSP